MFNAKLIENNKLDEQEIILEIYGQDIVCCAIYCPYQIHVGNFYPVELEVVFIDEMQPKSIPHEVYGIEKIGTGYEYILRGKLTGDSLNVGRLTLKIEGLDAFTILDGKFIELRIHGIWAIFLTKEEIND